MEITNVRLFKINLDKYNSENNLSELPSSIINKCYKDNIWMTGSSLSDISDAIEYNLIEVLDNNAPNNIRGALLFNLYGSETKILDPNESNVKCHNYENYIPISRSEELIDRVLYTNTISDTEPKTVISSMSYKNGYQELILVISDFYKDNNYRYILAVFENYDSINQVYTRIVDTVIKNDSGEAIESSTDDYMLSSGIKTIRVLLSGYNDDSSMYSYARAFKDADLGILEISSNLFTTLNTKVNTISLRKFIKENSLTLSGDKLLSRGTPIMFKIK